jgi:hypothetical protein
MNELQQLFVGGIFPAKLDCIGVGLIFEIGLKGCHERKGAKEKR